MKQFNLKEYLENPSRKIVTRDGSKVRIICTDKKGVCPIVALVTTLDGVAEETTTYTKNGKVFGTTTTKYDLFFAPEKHEGWINVYKDGDHFYSSMDIFKTKEKAEALSCRSCIATVKVEWEE